MQAETESNRHPWNPSSVKGGSAFSILKLWGRADECSKGSEAESSLLSHIGFSAPEDSASSATTLSATGDSRVSTELIDVDIDSSGNYVHTLVIKQSDAESVAESADSNPKQATGKPAHNLVLTHGYFTGLGFYYRNYRELSEVDGWNIYSIDWLGMGRSSRPRYESGRAKSEEARVAGAEAFFVESLEEWRKRVGIEKMMLCGHSFGGYMSALYALKYPEHVEKLVLISPIGIPEAPPDYEEQLRKARIPRNASANKQSSATSEDAGAAKKEPAKPSFQQNLLFKLALNLWERNFAPQWLIRTAGPFGHRLINRYVSRFTWLSERERGDLAAYTYHISALPGSSEYALGDILKPGAFARRPLVNRLAGMAVPTVFMYGANDWVDYKGGEEAMRRMGSGIATRLYRIPKAGHNLHLENPDDFNKALIREMADMSK
ncbi:alpha/beta-hydrolase [Martensiomyces pterosporus]|nr:alpha/beta-hydrolase [Martensiomyces pterosporus]